VDRLLVSAIIWLIADGQSVNSPIGASLSPSVSLCTNYSIAIGSAHIEQISEEKDLGGEMTIFFSLSFIAIHLL